MSLEGYNLRKPVWKLKVLRAPPEIDQALLERSVVRLQYTERIGKGEFPKFVIEFDNSSHKIWSWSTLAIGLRLKIRFGYQNLLSRPFLAVVTTVKGKATNSAGKPVSKLGSPEPDPHGLVIMEAKAYAWKLHGNIARTEWVSADGLPLTKAIREIARAYGYQDQQIVVQPGVGWSNTQYAKEPAFDITQIRADQSPLEYLTGLAAEYNVAFKHNSSEFRWHNPGYKEQQVYTITYYDNPDLLDYSVEGDFAMSPSLILAKSADPLQRKSPTIIMDQVIGPQQEIVDKETEKQYKARRAKQSGISYTAEDLSAAAALIGGAVVNIFEPSKPADNLGRKQQVPAAASAATIHGAIAAQPKPRGRALSNAMYQVDVVRAPSAKLLAKAIARAKAIKNRKWGVKLSLVGNPQLFTVMGVGLANFGPLVDGVWSIKEVEHIFDSEGYTTRLFVWNKRAGKGMCPRKLVPIMSEDHREVVGYITVMGSSCGMRPDKKKKGRKKPERPKSSVKTRKLFSNPNRQPQPASARTVSRSS